jgi:molecular chaperone Hsp33
MNDILNTSEADSLHRFMFEHAPIRGELVHLDTSWRSVIERHDYPETLRNMMGELSAAAVLFAATLKLKGSLVLQIMGKGAIKLLVVECNGDMQLRATAKWSGDLAQGSFAELVGDGQFAITLDPKDGGQPYQGIVGLEGSSVAEILQNYMSHSEQLETRLWLVADGQYAAGMLLQKMPDSANHDTDHTADEPDDTWQRASILADTLKPDELFSLSAQGLLKRLYHEDDIRLFDAQTVTFHCSCSRDNVAMMLKMLGHEEVESILQERDSIEVFCEFCNQRYEFDKVDTSMMFIDSVILPPSESRH